MLYKTMVLELLQQRPEMHDQLRKNRTLVPTLERYANQLRTRHLAWKEEFSQARPASEPSQVASEALEIALKELEDSLDSASPPNGSEPLSLDAAMAYLRAHTLPA
jgi:hypothetical protein